MCVAHKRLMVAWAQQNDVATHVATLEDEYTSLLSDVGVTASMSHAASTPSGAAHTGAQQAVVAQTAVCGEETRLGRVVPSPCTPLPRAATDEREEGEVMGGDEKEEGEVMGGDEKEEGEVSGDAEDVDVALDAHHVALDAHHGHATPDAAPLQPSAAEGIVAAGRGVEVVNNELIGKVCFEVLTLKREGDDVIEALKSAIAEEEDTSEARRDVLLTLLGGMLSWSGLLSDLGILVSDEMTNGLSHSLPPHSVCHTPSLPTRHASCICCMCTRLMYLLHVDQLHLPSTYTHVARLYRRHIRPHTHVARLYRRHIHALAAFGYLGADCKTQRLMRIVW